MDDDSLQQRLDELVKALGGTPDGQQLADLARQVVDSHQKLRASLDSLQEALDYLRVCIKYQAFNLDCTRRENEYLKKLLEDKNKDHRDP
jgi:hypothetical protein